MVFIDFYPLFTENKACQECTQPDTFEAIVDNYCRADFGKLFHVKHTNYLPLQLKSLEQ